MSTRQDETVADSMKVLAKRALRRAGLRISRSPGNRFAAMDETLLHLFASGYRPSAIVDGGANKGQFARLARGAFPDATIHMIEPQAACAPSLDALAAADGRMEVYKLLVTVPGRTEVALIGGGPDGGSTGAFVPVAGEQTSDPMQQCKATTLDELFAERFVVADRTLLKLDLEGHELDALSGAEQLLRKVEVVVLEVQFYDVNGAGRATFIDLANWLAHREFALFDLAALAARRRDGRLRAGDAVFVRRSSPLCADISVA